jgi:hypothetical protein
VLQAMMIAEMALDLRRSALSSKTAAEYADEVIALLHSRGSLVPACRDERFAGAPARSTGAPAWLDRARLNVRG